MKQFVAGFAAAAVIAASAAVVAQVAIPEGVFYKGQMSHQWLAKDLLLTAKVQNSTGQIIGDIEDLILNDNNQIEGVVMGTGGFLGAGEKKVGVKLSALKIADKDGKRTITLPEATKEVLAALKPYERATPPKSLFDRAMEKAKELADKTAETSKDAYQSASEMAKDAADKASKAAKEAYDKAKDAAQPPDKK